MKKPLLSFFTCLLTLTITFSSAQVNDYFNNKPMWQVSSSCGEMFPCVVNKTFNYFIIGDTTINSFVYKNIYSKGYGSYFWSAPPPAACSGSFTFYDSIPVCYLRSAGKQMFIRVNNDTTEYLLYDFNLSVGDTLPMTYNNLDPDITVTAMDSIYTPYGWLDRFTLSSNAMAGFLIEGIGSDQGLIEPVFQVLECGYTLNCFGYNDTAYYPSTGPNCELTLGINEISQHENPVVSPNPFSNIATIYLNMFVRNASVFIFNNTGQKVRTLPGINGDRFQITRGDLPSGLYYYSLSTDSGVIYSGKMTISDQ